MARQGRDGAASRNGVLSALAAAAIALAAVAALLASRSCAGAAGAVARVTDADGKVTELPLREDAELTVTTSLGTNVVEVAGGRVRVREADCPNQDCVRQGWVGSAGQEIVCLPHRLVVEVVGGPAADVDVAAR